MKYLSTRDKTLRFTAAEAIKMGLSRDGGLFTPETFPTLTEEEMKALCAMTYQQRAAYIMGKFLTDFHLIGFGSVFSDNQAVKPYQFNSFGIRIYNIPDNRSTKIRQFGP